MLEAVNSVVSNAPLLKVSTDNTRIDKGAPTAPDTIQNVSSGAAPYISPYVYVSKGEAVLQIRDNNTGDVQRQIPQQAASQPSQPVVTTEAEITSTVSAEAITTSQGAAPAPVEINVPAASTQTAAVEYASTAEAVTNTAPSTGGEVSVST